MTTSHGPDPECKFIQNGRIGTHLTNVSSASPKGYTTADYNQVHHILCHSCVQDAAIYVSTTEKPFVKACLAITNWDVNNPKNLIGLPLKKAYPPDAQGGKYSDHASWDKLTCHQHDHNPYYTDAVKKWLQDNIWSTLKGKVEECNVAPKDVKSLLDKGSKHWQDFLVTRGGKEGGTKACWDERNGAKKKKWWIPFSMWPGPVSTIPERIPPPDNFKWDGKMSSIMAKIK